MDRAVCPQCGSPNAAESNFCSVCGAALERADTEHTETHPVVSVGDESLLYTEQSPVHQLVWAHQPVQGEVLVQCSAHGTPHAATLVSTTDGAMVEWQQPQRRVSPGQSVVFYDATDTRVLGGGIAG